MSLVENVRELLGEGQIEGVVPTVGVGEVLERSGIEDVLHGLVERDPRVNITKGIFYDGQLIFFGAEWLNMNPGINGGLDYPARTLGMIVWVRENSIRFIGNRNQIIELNDENMYDRKVVKEALFETSTRPFLVSPSLLSS